MTRTPLSQYLKMLRRQHGYKQSELADFLGITRAAYSHYETARNVPTNDLLCKLAEFYDISLTKLIHLSGSSSVSSEVDINIKTGHFMKEPTVKSLKFIKECADMSPEEIARWLTVEDRELVFFYHRLSKRDKKILFNMANMMAAGK